MMSELTFSDDLIQEIKPCKSSKKRYDIVLRKRLPSISEILNKVSGHPRIFVMIETPFVLILRVGNKRVTIYKTGRLLVDGCPDPECVREFVISKLFPVILGST